MSESELDTFSQELRALHESESLEELSSEDTTLESPEESQLRAELSSSTLKESTYNLDREGDWKVQQKLCPQMVVTVPKSQKAAQVVKKLSGGQ